MDLYNLITNAQSKQDSMRRKEAEEAQERIKRATEELLNDTREMFPNLFAIAKTIGSNLNENYIIIRFENEQAWTFQQNEESWIIIDPSGKTHGIGGYDENSSAVRSGKFLSSEDKALLIIGEYQDSHKQ